MKSLSQQRKEIRKKTNKYAQLNREWTSIRSLLGYSWAMFYMMLGGREAGKSYAVTHFFCHQWREHKRPFNWLRLTDDSKNNLLKNNAEKLIDPDIRRYYKLDLTTIGDDVYEVLERDDKGKILKKERMARVLSLSTFYSDKGSGLFDKDFLKDKNMYYNICLDEMNREKSEKNSFDIVYAFTNQLENLIRSTKQRVRIICIGNTLEEASDILCTFNFIPEDFGRYKLKKKRAVIEYIEPSEKYLNRRRGTVADILMPTASTFTNKIEVDNSLVTRRRLTRPQYIIKFRRDKSSWFTCWDGNVIATYNGEQSSVIPMRPYLDETFITQNRDNIILQFDSRSYMYKNLVTFKFFQKEMQLLKPRK